MLALTSGCSGGGPYCDAVDTAKDQLVGFNRVTQQNFADNAKAVTAITEVAPADIKPTWLVVDKATTRVVNAQRKAGIALEDLKSQDKVDALSQADIERLNKAFDAFNDTREQREDVVKNVNDECGIDLSEK